MAKKPEINMSCQSQVFQGTPERAILNPVTRWWCKGPGSKNRVGTSSRRLSGLKMREQQLKWLQYSPLPGGNRNNNGNFNNIGNNGYWWSASAYSSTNAWNRNMSYNNADVNRNNNNKKSGFSVRCVRDLIDIYPPSFM